MTLDPVGNAVHGVRVMFTTGRGVAGSVFLSDTVYADPAQVREAIDARAAHLDAVATMTQHG